MAGYNTQNYVEQGGDVLALRGSIKFPDQANEEIAARKLNRILFSNDVFLHTANGAIAQTGKNVITGGTGIAGLTLSAPVEGCLCDIIIQTISSGDVVVTCASGVTFDGTNNTATFDTVADRLQLVYRAANRWEIFINSGVVLSSV